MTVPMEQYTTRLAAAGSMLPELTVLIEKHPDPIGKGEYRRLVVSDNLFGRPNLLSREKIWEALVARYALDPAASTFRLFLDRYRGEPSPSQRGLLDLRGT